MGSCVLRETIRKGRPRFAPRVSLSIYLSDGRPPAKADPTFAAYPHSPRALCLGGTPQLTASGESYRASPGTCGRPVRTRYLHSARMIISDVLTCTVPPLRVESSLLKKPTLVLGFHPTPTGCPRSRPRVPLSIYLSRGAALRRDGISRTGWRSSSWPCLPGRSLPSSRARRAGTSWRRTPSTTTRRSSERPTPPPRRRRTEGLI
jgi:hypothetical protein